MGASSCNPSNTSNASYKLAAMGRSYGRNLCRI